MIAGVSGRSSLAIIYYAALVREVYYHLGGESSELPGSWCVLVPEALGATGSALRVSGSTESCPGFWILQLEISTINIAKV